MAKDTLDNLEGAAMLIPFLILCYLIGRAIARFQNARYRRAFAPIAPLIEGEIHRGGNGDTGTMSGTYRGKRVITRITPNTSVSPGVKGDMIGTLTQQKRNLFEIEMPDLAGAERWSYQYLPRLPQKSDWDVSSPDAALESRLKEAGVAAAVEALGHLPAVWFTPGLNNLQYRENIAPNLTPSPERFQQQLDLMANLAEINARVNPA